MNHRTPCAHVVVFASVASAFLAATAAPAAAETREVRTTTLGWLVEKSELVAVALPGETRGAEGAMETDLRIVEVVRGAWDPARPAVLAWSGHGETAPWTADAPHLVFLVRAATAAGEPQRWEPVSGPFGVKRLLTEGPESRFTSLAKEYAATLDADGAVARADDLRALLVRWMGDVDPGVTWSAAIDFVRHRALHEGLSAEQRTAVTDAFRASAPGRDPRRALALAVAAARGEEAAEALTEGLRDEGARLDRATLGEALRRLGDADTMALLEAEYAKAADAPATRADVLVALGLAGDGSGLDLARAALADEVVEVRLEAAHALGLQARAFRAKAEATRRADPATEVEGGAIITAPGVADLVAALESTTDESALRACLWALAQLDDPAAWALLRKVAAEDERASIRAAATRYLANPRQSLLL